APGDSDLKGARDSDDVESSFGRIAVGVAPADFGGRNVSAGQLRLGEIAGPPELLHGFADVVFGDGFVFSPEGSDESFSVQPGHGVIDGKNVIGLLVVFFREEGIHSFAQVFAIKIGGGETQSLGELRQGRNAVVG